LIKKLQKTQRDAMQECCKLGLGLISVETAAELQCLSNELTSKSFKIKRLVFLEGVFSFWFIELRGMDIRNVRRDRLQKQLGLVPQCSTVWKPRALERRRTQSPWRFILFIYDVGSEQRADFLRCKLW
jgi:hypothetical protein